jgi:hypothetical protein
MGGRPASRTWRLCAAYATAWSCGEGGWSVRKGADGALLFAPPGGKALVLDPPGEWDGGGSFDFDPEVNFPLWDGSRPDYKLAVSGLIEAT